MRAWFTPQAEADLEEIGDYIALDNPERAVSFEPFEDGALILRILQGARNLPGIFGS